MADSEETLLKNDVAIVEINNLTSRLARKRTRSLDGLEEKPLEQQRKKETFSDDIDEIELRDKLLDEASSSQLSLDSDNINNVSEFDHGGCNESQEAGHRKIIKCKFIDPCRKFWNANIIKQHN